MIVEHNKKSSNLFRLVPVVLLLFTWLLTGRADPGGVLEKYIFLRWLSYPFIFISAIIWMFQFTLRPKILISGIEKYIMIIIIILTISIFLNNKPLRDLFEGAFVYLRYPFFFLLIICNFKNYKDFLPFKNMLIAIYFLIIIEGLTNYLLFGYSFDSTFISLGHSWGHAIAGIWLLYGFLIISSKYLVLNKTKWIIFLSLITTVIFAIANIRSGFLFLPILFIISWLTNRHLLKPEWIGFMGIIVILLIIVSALYTNLIYNGILPFPDVINPQFRLNYIGGVLVELIDRNQLFFGAGPRSMQPGSLSSTSALTDYLLKYFPSLMRGGSNQFVKALPEIGLMGFLFYWLMLLKIFKIAIKIWNAADVYMLNKNEKAICISFFPIWLHYASFGLFTNDLWRFDISSIIFWMMAAQIFIIHFKYTKHQKSYLIYL